MVGTLATILYALAHVSLVDAVAFVRRCIALWGAASQRARRAIHILILAVKPANENANDDSTRTRLYTVRYIPQRSKTTFFAMEREVVDWRTDIVDHGDGRVQYVATPVYAECVPRPPVETFYPEYETIETTQVLDVAKLLAQKHVWSVTCEQVSTNVNSKHIKTTSISDDEATASESDTDSSSVGEAYDAVALPHRAHEERAGESLARERDNQQGDEQVASERPTITIKPLTNHAVFDWTIAVYQSAPGTPSAVGSVLLQRRLLGL